MFLLPKYWQNVLEELKLCLLSIFNSVLFGGFAFIYCFPHKAFFFFKPFVDFKFWKETHLNKTLS